MYNNKFVPIPFNMFVNITVKMLERGSTKYHVDAITTP